MPIRALKHLRESPFLHWVWQYTDQCPVPTWRYSVKSPIVVSERRVWRSRSHLLREWWMTHEDQICSLKNTLLAHARLERHFLFKKATVTSMPLKSSKKRVQENGWSKLIFNYFVYVSARLKAGCSVVLLLAASAPLKISSCDPSHRQINVPRSYIYQHFHPYHVLDHLRHAETWLCRQI